MRLGPGRAAATGAALRPLPDERGAALSLGHRRVVLAVGLFLAASGLAWMAGELALGARPELDGADARTGLHLVLVSHGIAGYVAAVLFGSLLGRHVPAGLRSGRKRPSGLASVALAGGLLASALGLYYASSDGVRELASWLHQGLGVIAVAAVGLHVGRRRRAPSESPPR